MMKNERKDREKEQADSELEKVVSTNSERPSYFQSGAIFRIEDVFRIFGGGTHQTAIGDEDAEDSAGRKSERLVSPALEFLNSVVDLTLDSEKNLYTTSYLLLIVNFIGRTHTDEAYQGLTTFLNRLLTGNPGLKHLLLMETVLALAEVSVALDMTDSVPILTSAVPHLQNPDDNLSILVEHFDRLNSAEGIKEILAHPATSKMPEVEDRCLALLQKHDPEFVEEWQARKAIASPQNKESS